MRRDYQTTSPILWVATQFGRFLGDGYREIRGLIASNAPDNLKKVFTGSMAALVHPPFFTWFTGPVGTQNPGLGVVHA